MMKVTVDILLDVDDEDSAADCIAETLRDSLKRFAPLSSILDWQYSPGGHARPSDGKEFSEWKEISEGCATCEASIETRAFPCDECGAIDEDD